MTYKPYRPNLPISTQTKRQLEQLAQSEGVSLAVLIGELILRGLATKSESELFFAKSISLPCLRAGQTLGSDQLQKPIESSGRS
jgi:hypothetical protein